METKNIQTLTFTDEDCNSGSDNDEQVESGDSNMFSVVGEDQENTSIYVDSVFENRQVDDSYEKIALDCEEQVVMATLTELMFPLSDEDPCSEIIERNNVGEMMINNENYEHVSAIEMVVEVEDKMEYEKAKDIIIVEASENEEIFFMNATIEVACVKEVNNLQVLLLEEEKQIDCDDDMIPGSYCDGNLSNKTCPTNPIIREIHQHMQYNNKQVVIREALMNEREEEERVSTKDDLVKKPDEIPHSTDTRVNEASKVDDTETLVVVL